MTSEEFANRYVAGNEGNIEEATTQKLWIKFGLMDVLIESVDIFTDKEIIKEIINSDLLKNENYTLKKGKIKDIKELEGKELVEHLYEVEIEFAEQHSSEEYRMKGLCDKNRMIQYINQEIQVIAEREKDGLRFCCFLKDL